MEDNSGTPGGTNTLGTQTLDFESDTVLSLTQSRSTIDRILTSKSEQIIPQEFHPDESPRYMPPDHAGVDFSYGADDLKTAIVDGDALALADFEKAVQNFLEHWVTQQDHGDNTSLCTSLTEYFAVYSTEASEMYKSNVEDQSTMLLTLLELWMAVDRLAVRQLPLLQDYHPEVSPELVEALLLPTFNSTQRGAHIMKHCRMRAQRARFGSVFSDEVSDSSFSVRYFQRSPQLQDLKSQIIQAATSARSAAIQEFLRTREFYESLISKAGEQPI